ncbi:MAG: hypothetical protein ACRDD8_15090 [Bacteroidales bacterium]
MAQIKFWRGNKKEFDVKTRVDGMLYFVLDSGEIYLGTSATPVATNSDTNVSDLDNKINSHVSDNVKHITSAERTKWDKNISDLTSHVGDSVKHITSAERTKWDGYNATISGLGTKIDGVKSDLAQEVIDRTAGDNAIKSIIGGSYTSSNTVASAIQGVDGKFGSGFSSSSTVRSAIDALDSKITNIVMGGGAMVFQGTFTSQETLVAIMTGDKGTKFKSGYSFVAAAACTIYTTIKLEIGDMLVYVGAEKPANTGVLASDWNVIQANLTSAVQTVDDGNLAADNIVLGGGNKSIKSSSITAASLTSAITKANKAILTDGGNQSINGTFTATSFIGNATSATKLANARTFSITGGATAAAVNFTGESNVALEVTAVSAAKLTGGFPQDNAAQQASSSVFGLTKLAANIDSTGNVVPTAAMVKTAIGSAAADATNALAIANANKTAIGNTSDSASETGSIYARIAKVKADLGATNSTISAIRTELGTKPGNFVGTVYDNITNLNGTVSTQGQSILALQSQLTWIEST